MKDLYIIGAGGFGREVAWLVERINEVSPTWNIKGFIDDNESLWGSIEGEYPVLGGCEYLNALCNVYAVCAVGSAKIRKNEIKNKANMLEKQKFSFDSGSKLSNCESKDNTKIIGSMYLLKLKSCNSSFVLVRKNERNEIES